MSKRKHRKRHGFRNFLLFCFILVGVWYVNTYTLKTTEVTIESDKIKDDITIVQITDLHGVTFGENNEYLLKKIKDIDPDFIVSTGDMYTYEDAAGEAIALELLSNLAKEYTVYSVNGEHDYDESFEEQLSLAGVDVLDYEMRKIHIGSTEIHLYGTTNVYYSQTFDLANAFAIDKSKFNLLIAHITNFEAFAGFGMDLSLCGDSHGGVIRLPYLGGLINRDQWLPEQKEGEVQYVKGLYEKENSKLFVSSGLGDYPVPIRLLNRPEVAVIQLKAVQ